MVNEIPKSLTWADEWPMAFPGLNFFGDDEYLIRKHRVLNFYFMVLWLSKWGFFVEGCFF